MARVALVALSAGLLAALASASARGAEACDLFDASFRGQVLLGDFAVADGAVVRAGRTYVQALADALTLNDLCAEDTATTAERRAAFEVLRSRSEVDRKFVDLVAASAIPDREALSDALAQEAQAAQSRARTAAASAKPLTAETNFELAALYFGFAAAAGLPPRSTNLTASQTDAAQAARAQRCKRLTDEADSFVRFGERSEEYWVNSGEAQARIDAVEIYRVAAARLQDLKIECDASSASIDALLGEIASRMAMLR